MKIITYLLLLLICCSGCSSVEPQKAKLSFERIFNWTPPNNEYAARRYYHAGATDVLVRNQKQFDLVVKFNMTPYWGCFTPAGPHRQVLTPEEAKVQDHLNGIDLAGRKISKAERKKIITQRQREKDYRFGGPTTDPLETLHSPLYCFISDKDLKFSKEKIDKLLDKAPAGSAGIYFDFFGYNNFRGCYCRNCLALLQEFLKQNNLKDTIENRGIFYRDQLVRYYNRMVDYVKSKRPGYKVIAHFYPDFQFEPFFGNRTKVDYAGQTVAWYFKVPLSQIAADTRKVIAEANHYQPRMIVIPFLGLNTDSKSALGFKSPEDLEKEMQTILAAGGKSLMICCGRTMSEPGYYEVFCKYSSKSPDKTK